MQLQQYGGDSQAGGVALAQLQQVLAEQKLAEAVAAATKDLHSAVSSLGKVLTA